MEANNSFGTSWADQWDYNNPDPVPENRRSGDGGGGGGGDAGAKAKYSKKLGESFGKTKAAASTGAKKVKEGASVGIHWIKDKYHKTTQKN
ncbi:hypothetical protein L1049_006443 [Liquidambar formosana]|uniref:Uncharacterized protein n=1 Tax=Liquidambar formosana TaxID=63359 RepID=A0AAP0RFJ2_LIQFO